LHEGVFPFFLQLVLSHESLLHGRDRDKTIDLETLLKLLGLDGGVDAAGDVVEYGVKKADNDGLAAPLELLDRERLGVS